MCVCVVFYIYTHTHTHVSVFSSEFERIWTGDDQSLGQDPCKGRRARRAAISLSDRSISITSKVENTKSRVSRFNLHSWLPYLQNSFLIYLCNLVSYYLYYLLYREEDHDDVLAIVDGKSIPMMHLKELYGEYCISEMIRHPNSCRRLIIGEDPTDGSAVGVVCLNSTIDVDLLSENFELTPYNGLTKPRGNDGAPQAQGDTLSAVEANETMHANAGRLADHVFPSYHSHEINVFVLEIFAMRDETWPHWSHDFLEAAFDCFPHLEYCAILLPFLHPCYQFLQHFVVLAKVL